MSANQFNSWRDYQKKHRKIIRKKHYRHRAQWLGLCAGGILLILVIIFYTGPWIFAHLEQQHDPVLATAEPERKETDQLFKQDLPDLLKHVDLYEVPPSGTYFLEREGKTFALETSLDPTLQNYIKNLLRRSQTHQAAVVVMKPVTGQIIAMVHYENHGTGGGENLCLKADFPAASLCKIISAAAALEVRGFTPDKTLEFRGRKHTLYKSQLRKGRSRYTVKTSFKKAFSGSINSVFGKIGIYDLGREAMSDYAERFWFNRKIPFDLPLDESSIQVPDDDFGLAEIASGFNKRTLISPLHAALITAAIANQGIMMEPWLVRQVSDESGKTLYRSKPLRLGQPITAKTAKDMRALMMETVKSGTSRKAFRVLRRKKAFKNIELGAKTGTINDKLDQYKFDWLTTYALPKEGDDGVSAAILAIHGERLGIRARDIGKYVIDFHFNS